MNAAKVLLIRSVGTHITEVMTMTLLTCVACGKRLLVRDEPDEKRDKQCACKGSMIERRPPGSVL